MLRISIVKPINPLKLSDATLASIIRAFKSNAFYKLLAPFECGPFDGGCLIVARAVHSVFGGEMISLHGANASLNQAALIPQHAAVRFGRMVFDARGLQDGEAICRFWETNEHLRNVSIHPFKAGDLGNDAVMDEATVLAVAAMIRKALL
jgi:hypothetical protein